MRRTGRIGLVSLLLVVTAASTLAVSVGSPVDTPPAAAAPPPASTFHGLTPARLADTRPNGATVDNQGKGTGALGPGGMLDVAVAGRGGVPALGVGSVALNVTAINPTAASFVTVYPAGATRPNASNLNLAPGRTLPNMVIVPLGANGRITLYNDRGSTHLAVDVLGWFPAGVAFQGLTPARLADTRPTGATVDGQAAGTGAIAGGTSRNVVVTGRGGVPSSGVGAVALNVTAVNPTAASFVTVYPAGETRPTASNLNLAAGRTLPNMVVVPVGAGGAITAYNDRGSTHLAVDVLGWFPEGTGFTGLTPARLHDSRTGGVTVDGQSSGNGLLYGGTPRGVVVRGRGGVPMSGAGSVVLNVTAVMPSESSFVTVYPFGAPRPHASNLNLERFRTLPNLVIVPLGGLGIVHFYNDKGSTHLLVDVLGWFPSTVSTNPTTSMVSVSSEWEPGSGDAESPSISADGRFVAFSSLANNLVTGDSNGVSDVFVRDTLTHETTRVSVSTAGGQGDGTSFNPRISADGRYVVFTSSATNLVAGDTNDRDDVFVHDRVTAQTTRVSVRTGGTQAADGHSAAGPITPDGRYVVFSSQATNLVSNDDNGVRDIFRHDRFTNTTIRVSVTNAGAQAMGGGSFSPSISADGRLVLFDSSATNLVLGDGNGVNDVFLRDLTAATTTLVSTSLGGGFPNGGSDTASMSADGRFVAFQSLATNLVTGDSNATWDVFVKDRTTGETTRVSVSTNGDQSNLESSGAVISASGRYVAFASLANNLVDFDSNAVRDVFVHDRFTGDTERVSLSNAYEQGTAMSFAPSISASGQYVAFASDAPNLLAADLNGKRDVFVRDRGVAYVG